MPSPGVCAPASEAALQQRIELLERHTAAAKGKIATLQTAWHRLDTRPSLDACQSFADAATRSLTDLEALATEYTTLGSLAAAHPERAAAAVVGAVELRRTRDDLLAHALTVTRICERLPPEAGVSPLPRPRPLPVALGTAEFVAERGVVFLWGPEAAGYAQPGGGLRAGRLLAGALETLPELVLVRLLEPVSATTAFGASFLSPGGPGRAATRGSYLDTRGWPLRVVVLPGHGPLAETPVLYGIARSFADGRVEEAGCRVHGSATWLSAEGGGVLSPRPSWPSGRFSPFELAALGLADDDAPARIRFLHMASNGTGTDARSVVACEAQVSVPPGGRRPVGSGPSAALLVISTGPPSERERARLLEDWRSFTAPGADADLARSNFFEATGGRASLTPLLLSPRAGGCTSGAPDLP